MGANRMSERLLGLYWQILLALLIGDIIVGIIWLFRYNLLLTNLRSDLVYRLDNDYGFDSDFQELWDRIQSEHQCCGIDTPYDYNVTQWFEREHSTYEGAQFLVPQSCCAYSQFPLIETIESSMVVDINNNNNNNGIGTSDSAISDGTISKEEINSMSSAISKSSQDDGDAGGGGGVNNNLLASRTSSADCMDSYRPENIYTTGCYAQVLEWLQSSVDCLSVIGFCVITFLKFCFAFILRYEIREMIQKINLIKGDKERNDSTTLQNLEAYLPRKSLQPDQPPINISPSPSPHSQHSNNITTTDTNINTITNINIDNINSTTSNTTTTCNPNVTNSNINVGASPLNTATTITAIRRNRISKTNQSSFNSSIGSYVSCGGPDSTTINIPGRHSPQSIGGNVGITFTTPLTSPPTKRLIISSSVTTSTPTVTTTSICESSSQSSTILPTPSPATLITTVTNDSLGGAETTILPQSPTSSIVNPSQLLGLISIPMSSDFKSNNKNKSFNNKNSNNNNNTTNGNNSNSNNQVLVTNF